jgi:hypothetical protein
MVRPSSGPSPPDHPNRLRPGSPVYLKPRPQPPTFAAAAKIRLDDLDGLREHGFWSDPKQQQLGGWNIRCWICGCYPALITTSN